MERKKRESILVYICYTLGFVVLAAIMVSIFYMNGKSIVYNSDAIVQHYPTQFYLSRFMSDLFNGIQKFNFNLGLGQDVLFTYHYYGLTDPLNILLGVFSWVDPNLLYSLSLGLRMYIAGLVFIGMCIHFKKSSPAMAIGALIYVFSNYCLSAGVMHPYFTNAMIYLPLMVIGVDKLIKENKVMFFIVVSILSILSNVYFAYIVSVLAFVYAIISIISECRKNGFKETIRLFGRGITSYIIAAMICGAIIVPMAYGFVNSARTQGLAYEIPLLMNRYNIIQYFVNIFQKPNVNNFALVGVSVATLYALASMFLKKGNGKLKVLSILMLILIIGPKVQSAVTGFSYENFRWYFALELLMAYIFVNEFDELLNMKSIRKKVVFLVVVVYLALFTYKNVNFAMVNKIEFTDFEFLVNMVVVLIALILMLILCIRKPKLKRNLFIAAIFIALGSNISLYSFNAIEDKNLVSFKELDELINDRTLQTVSKTTKGTFERVDNEDPRSLNMSDIYEYPSSSVYYSIENKNLSKFNLIYRNAKSSPITRMHNFDGRAILDDIMSVKYYKVWNDKKVPYGFEKSPMDKLYINNNYIPFGFTYANYIKPYEVASMGILDKQEALLRGCLIDGDIGDVKHLDSGVLSDINLRKTDVDYKTDLKGKIHGKQGLNIKLEYNLPYNGELYLKIADSDAIKGVDSIYITTGGKASNINFTKPSSKWYYGEKDVVINMGYFEKGKKTMNINLPAKSEFNIKDITLECRAVDMIEPSVKELAKEHLRDIKIQKDGFTGNIANEGYKLMFISIPYDEGWTATIDGVKSKIYRANEGFMAVKLEPGDHTVDFRYKRPLQTAGYIVSLVGIVLLALYTSRRRKKFGGKNKDEKSQLHENSIVENESNELYEHEKIEDDNEISEAIDKDEDIEKISDEVNEEAPEDNDANNEENK